MSKPLAIQPQTCEEAMISLAAMDMEIFTFIYARLFDVPMKHVEGKPVEEMVDDIANHLDSAPDGVGERLGEIQAMFCRGGEA